MTFASPSCCASAFQHRVETKAADETHVRHDFKQVPYGKTSPCLWRHIKGHTSFILRASAGLFHSRRNETCVCASSSCYTATHGFPVLFEQLLELGTAHAKTIWQRESHSPPPRHRTANRPDLRTQFLFAPCTTRIVRQLSSAFSSFNTEEKA